MTTDTMPTGIDIEAMAREAHLPDSLTAHPGVKHLLRVALAHAADHFASIAERMGLEAQSDEAKRLAVEIGAAIRAEVG